MATLLIVDDDRDHIELVSLRLQRAGHEALAAQNEPAFRELVQRADLVLADYTMPSFGALRALDLMRELALDAPLIVVSGTIGEERAIDVMKHGAVDYLLKDHLGRLEQAVDAALERHALQRAVYVDKVSGLPTVAALFDAMREGAFAEGAIAVVGIVNQVEINRTFGRLVGDEVMQSVARRLTSLGPGTRAYRLPSAKFAVVLEGHDADAAARVLEQRLGNPSQLRRVEGVARHADFYCGVARYDGEQETPDALEAARVAFEQARHRKERFVVHGIWSEPGLATGGLVLVGDLSDAIVNSAIDVHLQPKIAVADGRLLGAEALARWTHPEHGFVPPDVFIGIAERSGFIHQLTQVVMRKAFAQASAWRRRGLDLNIAVNLSAHDLHHPGLVGEIDAMLREFDLEPERVTLEFTESVLMSDVEESAEVTRRLRDLGVCTSVDDFGTGYSSLAYLARLPLSELKIDRSFIGRIDEREIDLTIVETLVALGQKLDLSVVAEGVETPSALAKLVDVGCDVAQGYHIAKPLKPADFDAWVARYTAA